MRGLLLSGSSYQSPGQVVKQIGLPNYRYLSRYQRTRKYSSREATFSCKFYSKYITNEFILVINYWLSLIRISIGKCFECATQFFKIDYYILNSKKAGNLIIWKWNELKQFLKKVLIIRESFFFLFLFKFYFYIPVVTCEKPTKTPNPSLTDDR